MADYTVGMLELNEQVNIDFGTFVELVKGHSIVSLADWGNDRVEFGLSGGKMVRFFLTNEGIQVNLISTINKGEIPPIIINLGDLSQRTPISIVEKKLNGLRTIYDIIYLLQYNQIDILTTLSQDNFENIEDYIPFDEKLFLESTSYGSWILTLWSKAKGSFQTLLYALSLIYDRSREAMLKKLEAQAELKMIEVDLNKFDLVKKKTDYILELTSKIDNPELKQKVEKQISISIENLLTGEEDIKKLNNKG